jgi:methionyl-tRNA formyltransferase
MNIIFFGEDSFSAKVLESLNKNFNVSLTISPVYNNFIYKKLEAIALRNNIPFIRTNDFSSEGFLSLIKCLKPDLFIVCHFSKLLPSCLISLPKKGALNLHPSLLPKYRGMAPQHWPIINAEKFTGISIHFIDSGIDTGNIVYQKKIRIRKDSYVFELQKKLLKHYSESMIKAINLVSKGSCGYKQRGKSSYYGRFQYSDGEIILEKGARYNLNLIKALSRPYFGAYFKNLRIWNAEFVTASIEKKLKELNIKLGLFSLNNFEYILFSDGILKITDGQRIIK